MTVLSQNPRNAQELDPVGAVFSQEVPSSKDEEMSSAQMREFLLMFLNALAELAKTLIQTASTKSQWDVKISDHMADLSKKELEEVNKQMEEYLAQKEKSERSAMVSKIFGYIMCGLSILIASLTLNPALIIATVAISTLEIFGAMDKMGEAITKACGDNKLAAFFIKLAIVAVICIAAGGVSGVFQGTRAAGQEAAVEIAAEAGQASESTIAKLLQTIGKAFTTSQGRMIGTMTFGSTFGSTGALNDLIIYCVEKCNTGATEKEKKELEETLELVLGLVLAAICAVGGGITSFQAMKSGMGTATGGIMKKIEDFLQKSKYFLRFGNAMYIVNVFATLGDAIANSCVGAFELQQANGIENLANARALQEFFSKLMTVVSRMLRQNQDEWKNISEEIKELQQTQIRPQDDPDGAIFKILSA